MEKKETKIAVIGAGFAGLATAYYLVKKGADPVTVVEMEKKPGLGASTQNAAMICRFDEDAATSAMCAEGARLLEEEFVPALGPFGFRKTGSIFTASGVAGDARLRVMARNAVAGGAIVDSLSRAEALKLFPFLSDSPFESALYCNADALVDARALVDALAAWLAANGVTFLYAAAARVSIQTGSYLIKSASVELSAQTVVNAAGAWASDVARMAGAKPLVFEPMRRHIFVTEDLKWSDPESPIVWDVTNEIYFRPDGKKLWFSPCDETRHKAGPVETDSAVEKIMRAKIQKFFPRAAKAEWSDSWAGLRTFSTDRRFVIGQDKLSPGFYWVAGLGGHGVTVSPAVGRLAASLILGEKVSLKLSEAFSPARFK